MTDFQSEQFDYDRSGDRTLDFKHSSTLTIPLRHRSLIDSYVIDSIPNFTISIPLNFNYVSPAFIANDVIQNRNYHGLYGPTRQTTFDVLMDCLTKILYNMQIIYEVSPIKKC